MHYWGHSALCLGAPCFLQVLWPWPKATAEDEAIAADLADLLSVDMDASNRTGTELRLEDLIRAQRFFETGVWSK